MNTARQPVLISLLLVALNLSAHEPAANPQLKFIKNLRQFHPNVLYQADLNGGEVFLERSTLTYVFYNADDLQRIDQYVHHPKYSDPAKEEDLILRGHAYKVHLKNANTHAAITESGKFKEYYNYILGNDETKWTGHVPLFREVYYNEIYAGIDLKFYSEGVNPKYDFIIHPGTDAGTIILDFEGIDGLKVRDGNLEIATSVATIIEQKPHAFQIIDGKKVEVACSYKLSGKNVSLQFPKGYSQQHDLVIDPVIVASTYSGDTYRSYSHCAAYDDAGNIYSGGQAFSVNTNGSGAGYPVTTGAFQTAHAGGFQDIAVSKYDPNGSTLLWATYLGGSRQEQPHSMIVNSNQELYIYGTSNSQNYPTTANAYDRTLQADNFGNILDDIIVTKLSADGSSLVGSTYVGGRLEEDGFNWSDATTGVVRYYNDYFKGEIIVDAAGNAYVASYGRSTDFPTTAGVIQPIYGGGYQDGVVFKLNSDMSSLVWSTFLGGPKEDACYALRLDTNGDLFVTGAISSNVLPNTVGAVNSNYLGGKYDVFIAHISANGQSMIRSTYFGSSGEEQAYVLDLDNDGDVYIFGSSPNTAIQATPGSYNWGASGGFIAKLKPTLDSIRFITTFGEIGPTALMIDECEAIYAVGHGGLNDGIHDAAGFQTTTDAFQTLSGPLYMMVLEPDAVALRFGSYYGPAGVQSHVHGGTNRIDKRGILYHPICAEGSTLYTPSWAHQRTALTTDWDNCVFKIDFQPPLVEAIAKETIAAINDTVEYVEGCPPLTVYFINKSRNATDYRWYFGTGDSSTLFEPVYTYNDTGLYQVMLIAMDSVSCNQDDTAYVTVHVTNDSLQPDFTYSILSDCVPYEVEVTNTSVGGRDFHWDFGDGATATGQTATHVYANAGIYFITLTIIDSALCDIADSTSQSIIFLSRLDVQIAPTTQSGCVPLDASFISAVTGSANPTLLWNFGNGASSSSPNPNYIYNTGGNYQVSLIASDLTTCNGFDTAYTNVIALDDTVVALFSFATNDLCDSLQVIFINGSSPGADYQWDFGDGTNSTLQNPTHYYTASGVYNVSLIAVDSATCNIADTFNSRITFTALPELSVRVNDYSGCSPLTVQFQNTGTPAIIYQWDFGDNTTSTLASPSNTYAQPGQYFVKLIASDSNTCNQIDTAYGTVEVFDDPLPSFDYQPAFPVLGENVSFTNTSSNATGYLWGFGDGDSSTIANPVHAYSEFAEYRVCLTAFSVNGCSDSVCKKVVVNLDFVVDVPNAFTPNGDRANDTLFVKGNGIKTLDFRVYNRWGELVFESGQLNKGWDGTYKSEPQEMEAYGYYLKGAFLNDEPFEKKGNVTLIR